MERWALWIALALVAIATLRIAATYTTFSYTFDEPAHLACGMEWLEKHTYTYEPQHPPLTRVAVALLPRLTGAQGSTRKSMWDAGLDILTAQGDMDRTLALARAGTLPFFWLACWLTFLLTRWISSSGAAGVLAVFLVTMTPSVLAHGGLATTDMGLTATLLLAVYTGWRWIEQPSLRRAFAFGASTGLAVLAKFSTLVFLPSIAVIAALFWIIAERPAPARLIGLLRPRAPQALLAAAVGALVIWAGYLFSFSGVPAPELFSGLAEVRKHNTTGHLTYLLGAANTVGWPYFYLAALAVKTPFAILTLALPGLLLLCSRTSFGTRGWLIPSTVLGILIYSSLFTQIKIGTRHVLPVFVAFGIAGACAVLWTLRRFDAKPLVHYALALVLLSLPVVSLAAHPDYIPYFNQIAGDKPEAFLVDSDLDWSQDVKRLAAKLKEVGATQVWFNQYAPGDLPRLFGFPPILPLDPDGPQPGWNAVSVTPMKYGLFKGSRYAYDRGFQFWPDRTKPIWRTPGGLLLFYERPR